MRTWLSIAILLVLITATASSGEDAAAKRDQGQGCPRHPFRVA